MVTDAYLSSKDDKLVPGSPLGQVLEEVRRTSSRSEGRIFRVLSPSENRPRTPARPFMNEIFSSLVLAVKLLLSKKLSVEMGSEEKKDCEGSVDGVGRDVAWRVIRERNSAAQKANEQNMGTSLRKAYTANPYPVYPILGLVSLRSRVVRLSFHAS